MRFMAVPILLCLFCFCLTSEQLKTLSEFTSNQDMKEGLQLAGKAADAMRDFTPKEEYYLGRAVAATIMTRYPPATRIESFNSYLNLMGQFLVMFSPKPYLFKGYTFAVLDNDTLINAYASPGGHVLITSGLIRLCHTEDELAAVLAHEIGHICRQHALSAISKSKRLDFFKSMLKFAGRKAGEKYLNEDLKELTNIFDGFVGAISQKVLNGFSVDQEDEADSLALIILQDAGYAPSAMISFIECLPQHLEGHYKAHRSPAKRKELVEKIIAANSLMGKLEPERKSRFQKMVRVLQ